MPTADYMSHSIHDQADDLFRKHASDIHRRTDRMFACLMPIQWLGGILAAWIISPRTWNGAASSVHPHVWSAIILGALITFPPIGLVLVMPGKPMTRHVIAVSQMLMSSLLIHLTGGRIETHFHVFGSLAFLAFYRDWRVLVTATIVISADHFIGGIYLPMSVFGVLYASPWRAVEHAAWVIFEDTFLIIATAQSVREMRGIAVQRAQLESTEESLLLVQEGLEHQIVELRRAERKIQWQSYHDSLTGLPNRTLVCDRLEQVVAVARSRGEIIGVLVFSIDRFKQVTDSMGHARGDELLCQVALRIKECLGVEDTVARVGTELFTILLPVRQMSAHLRLIVNDELAVGDCAAHSPMSLSSMGRSCSYRPAWE